MRLVGALHATRHTEYESRYLARGITALDNDLAGKVGVSGNLNTRMSLASPAFSASPVIGHTFGELFRRVRETRGLTQAALAAAMKQSVSYVSLIENNSRRPTENVFASLQMAISDLTSVELAELRTAAHLPNNPLEQLVRSCVATLTLQRDVDAFDQQLIYDNLLQIMTGYRKYLDGKQHLAKSDFGQAARDFAALAPATLGAVTESSALPPALQVAGLLALADAALKQGNLDDAQKHVDQASALLNTRFVETEALALAAEALALRGLVAMRKGKYDDAVKAMTSALDKYKDLQAYSKPGDQVTAIGLTKSYNRLAMMALFRSDPKPAISYCASAERELDSVSPRSEIHNQYRLRLWALKAWAASQSGQFGVAHGLRQQALQAYTEMGDAYGMAKSWLYMGDDLRQQVQEKVEPQGERPPVTADKRRQVFGARLKPWGATLNEAEQYYQAAIAALTKLGESLLLGRAYRSLGDILRYKSLASESGWMDATQHVSFHLVRALEIERRSGQGRRVPNTYESVAKLEWDQGLYAEALNYYQSALLALNLVKSDDLAEQRLRNRCNEAISLLMAELGSNARTDLQVVVAADTAPMQSPADAPVPSPIWTGLMQQLVSAVSNALESASDLRPLSPKSAEWSKALYTQERQRGPRILVQDTFSSVLEEYPQQEDLPQELPTEQEPITMHLARKDLLLANLASGLDEYSDIYNQAAIQAKVKSNPHGRTRRDQALQLLREPSNRYHLHLVDRVFPVHFAVKGNVVLIEVPERSIELIPALHRKNPLTSGTVSYQFADDPNLARELTQVFWRMLAFIKREGKKREETMAWLSELTPEPTAPGSVIATSPKSASPAMTTRPEPAGAAL